MEDVAGRLSPGRVNPRLEKREAPQTARGFVHRRFRARPPIHGVRPRPARAGEAPPGELREPRAGLMAFLAAGFSPWCLAERAMTSDDGA
jgi:hypothetical protein